MAGLSVLGATSWGVTLAWLLARGGNPVRLLCRTEGEAREVRKRGGLARLPHLALDEGITVGVGPGPVPPDGLVVAVPAQSLVSNLRAAIWEREVPVLCAAKGIDMASSRLLPEVIASLGWPEGRISILSGPNLAHEIARGLPAASVVASRSSEEAERWQRVLMTPRFRVYTSGDVTGVAVAGALKNVVAIAAGAAEGLGYGTNALASLVTRGLAEITRIGVALGADPMTFQGLAGVGDLMATCFSPLSRNRRFGVLLAQGKAPEDALAEIGETVEGVSTAPVALALGRRVGVELPVAEAVTAVLRGELSVKEGARALLERPPAAEAEAGRW